MDEKFGPKWRILDHLCPPPPNVGHGAEMEEKGKLGVHGRRC